MDEQHRKLIELVNTMFAVMREKKDGGRVSEVLEEMMTYSAEHFEAEENLLAENGYPRLEEHQSLHQNFIQKLEKLKQLHGETPEAVTRDVYHYLREWWRDHILEQDKLYGPFLNDKGIM
jgi:hemerythrin-like metal-binding protein